MSVGGLTEAVEVTAVRGETVNRTSGELARVIDSSQIQDAALSGRNYLELASLIPGAVQLDDDQMAVTTAWAQAGPSSTETAATATTSRWMAGSTSTRAPTAA